MYFLNINKPKGITSFDVIKMLRKKLSIKQIGHSGTLDPLATGVLQVAVGKATKLLDYLKSDKSYIAEIVFGYVSDTFDDEGKKTFVNHPNFNEDDLLNVIKMFTGTYQQIPPKYSAIKINGQKLCNLARFKPDELPEIKPRLVTINSIELLDLDINVAKIYVQCEKGTYIRSLVNDIGAKLGCGAYIKNLQRTSAGTFKIENSDDIEAQQFHQINPIDVLDYPKYELSDIEFNRVINGNFINITNSYDSNIILLTKNNKLVSIANLSDNLIKPKRIFKGE